MAYISYNEITYVLAQNITSLNIDIDYTHGGTKHIC
jgi:hypothetical protein